DSGATVVLSERVARLPNAIERLRARAILPDAAVLDGCERHADRIAGGASVSLVRALPAGSDRRLIAVDSVAPPTAARPSADNSVPHLLSGHTATPITAPELYLHASGAASAERGPDACCTVARDADGLLLRVLDGHTVHLNSAPAAALEPLQPGDHLLLMEGAASFRIITVAAQGDA
ncbi:MAG: hypothetical protein KJO38_02525, partial [Gammaproteobacteria bacterium]|nr:hypothetical protein [Gammaproteobacteria bacterium]